MKKKRVRKVFKITDFDEIPKKDDRLNPQIIRKLFFHVYKEFFSCNFSEFAAALDENRVRHSRRKSNINANSIRKIIKDEQRISYYHLEALANYLKVPTYVLLLLTRFSSDEIEGEGYNKEGLFVLADYIKNEYGAEKIVKVEDIDKWIEVYRRDPILI